MGNKKSSGVDHHGGSDLAAQGAPRLVGSVPVGGCWLMFMMPLPSAGIQEGFSLAGTPGFSHSVEDYRGDCALQPLSLTELISKLPPDWFSLDAAMNEGMEQQHLRFCGRDFAPIQNKSDAAVCVSVRGTSLWNHLNAGTTESKSILTLKRTIEASVLKKCADCLKK